MSAAMLIVLICVHKMVDRGEQRKKKKWKKKEKKKHPYKKGGKFRIKENKKR